MRFLFILVAFGMFITGGYYFIWLDSMSRYVEQVNLTIDYYNSEFEKQGVTFHHDGMNVVGYPFGSALRMINPKIDYVQGNEKMRIGMAALTLMPLESRNVIRYDVLLEQPILTRYEAGSDTKNFEARITNLPSLYLRPDPESVISDAAPLPIVAQWGFKSVGPVRMEMRLGDAERAAQFPLQRTPMALWDEIPVSIGHAIQMFVYMQDEAFLR